MRSTLFALAAGLPLVLTAGAMTNSSPAAAMPAVAAGSSPAVDIIPVAEGCGPGFIRNFRGFCRPIRVVPRYGYGYGYGYRRRCVVRPGLLGPRTVCRY